VNVSTPAFAIAALALVNFCSQARAQTAYQTVAISGQTAEGTPGGAEYASFDKIVINERGQVAFRARLAGSSVIPGQNNAGIWRSDVSGNQIVARAGDPAPGTEAGTTYLFAGGVDQHSLTLSRSGSVGFFNLVFGPAVYDLLYGNGSGIWTGQPGSVALAARGGNQAPDAPIGTLYRGFYSYPSGFSSLRANTNGELAYWGTLMGEGVNNDNSIAIFAGGPLSQRMVVRQGDHAPGTSDGRFGDLSFSRPTINAGGQVAFRASFQDSSGGGEGVWMNAGSVTTLVARTGDKAPGLPSGTRFDRGFSYPVCDDNGRVGFTALLAGGDVIGSTSESLWNGVDGSLSMIARGGQQAAGTPSNTTFVRFDDIQLSNAGHTAFKALLTGDGVNIGNNVGIWRGRGDSLMLVARSGDLVPGGSDVFWLSSSTPYAMNNVGDIAMLAGSHILVSMHDAGLTTLLSVGDLFDVNSDPLVSDYRTIASLSISNGDNGMKSCWNDAGQLVFMASFADGSSGVFIASVPSPSAMMLFSCGLLAASRRRR